MPLLSFHLSLLNWWCLLDVFICCCCCLLWLLPKQPASTHPSGSCPWTLISFTCLRFQGYTRKLPPPPSQRLCRHLHWRPRVGRADNIRDESGRNSSWIEKVRRSLATLSHLLICFLYIFSSLSSLLITTIRLYTQLEYLKNKTLRQDNPHISKRRGGRKVAHRRFSLQVTQDEINS